MGFGNPDLSPVVKKRLWKGMSKEFCLIIIYVWTLYSNHMNSSLNLSPHCTSQLASAETLKRDPGPRGGSVTRGQALSAALVPPVTPLWDIVGPTVNILNSFCTKMWKPAPYGKRPMLRSPSALSSSSLVQSTFFLLSLFSETMICSLPSLPGSMCLPLHLLVLALCCSRGRTGSSPGPGWTGVVLALQWNHQLGSWPLLWVQGSRITTALFKQFFALFILCSPTKIYCPWDISGWH